MTPMTLSSSSTTGSPLIRWVTPGPRRPGRPRPSAAARARRHPQEVLENPELMELMLPTLRADFTALESYDHQDESPLPVPLTVFGGTADALVGPARLHGRRRQSSAGSRLRTLPGGHFFVHASAHTIMTEIAETLSTHVKA
ncbi:hypothetical protein Sipo8835_17595 [Streptomyces ipomoeae]|nr:hypothetical protein Sipo8835_17595 [Streptomyces ipomoeae]